MPQRFGVGTSYPYNMRWLYWLIIASSIFWARAASCGHSLCGMGSSIPGWPWRSSVVPRTLRRTPKPSLHCRSGTALAPMVVPGLSPWRGSQPLRSRERYWIHETCMRSVDLAYCASVGQLAIRKQFRQGILVAQAGRQPPVGQKCSECREPSPLKPLSVCISGSIMQKCNNYLCPGHANCSLKPQR